MCETHKRNTVSFAQLFEVCALMLVHLHYHYLKWFHKFFPEKWGPLPSQGFIALLITFLRVAYFDKHDVDEQFLVSIKPKENEGFVRTLTGKKSLI